MTHLGLEPACCRLIPGQLPERIVEAQVKNDKGKEREAGLMKREASVGDRAEASSVEAWQPQGASLIFNRRC
jgi:hypothetical protein